MLIFFIAWDLFLRVAIIEFKRSQKTKSWPKVRGYTEYLDITEPPYENAYLITCSYSYKVNNKKYRSGEICEGYSPGTAHKKIHYKIYDMLNSNEPFSVFYNPENPKESVLITGYNPFIRFTMHFSITWIIFTIFMYCAFIKYQI